MHKLDQLEYLYNHFSWLITIDNEKIFKHFTNKQLNISTREYCRAPFETIVKFLDCLNEIHGVTFEQILRIPCWINIGPYEVENGKSLNQIKTIFPCDKNFSNNSISAAISQHID